MKKTKKWKRILTVLCIFTMIAGIMSPSAIYAGDSTQETVAEQTDTAESADTQTETAETAETTISGAAGDASGVANNENDADSISSDSTVTSASENTDNADKEEKSESDETSVTTTDSGVEEATAESYPAVSLNTKTNDGTEINISAPEGAFPSGIQVAVTKVDSEQILSALKEASDNTDLTADQVVAYDFDFYLDNGEHNIEPQKEISVQFSMTQLKKDDSVTAYHLKDENSVAEKEDVTADVSAGTATLESGKFSIHALLLGSAENASGVTIDFDEKTDIHSVSGQDGTKIILYCMNNELHWPHKTPSIQNIPTYTETSLEEFLNANGITGDDQKKLKTNLENLLYAGYPYNGYSLYEIVDSVPTISEDDFNRFLTPPQYLRDDFPDSIGNNNFTYADRNDNRKLALLTQFLKEAGIYFQGGTTASGLNYQQLQQLPFWRAAYCMVYFSGDPIQSYSSIYVAYYYVTESQSYAATRDAIWTLLKNAGLKENGRDVTKTTLVDNLINANADGKKTILTEKPVEDKVSVSGDLKFSYSTRDGKWHTGALSITTPSTYHTPFSLILPGNITEETGKTQVMSGESFSLVSATKPDASTSISLSATIPWMDPDLEVYVADSSVTASDGTRFQNMIGAVIHKTPISKTVSVSSSNTSFTFTKIWKDNSNSDNVRPGQDSYKSKLHLMNGTTELTGFTPDITDNGNGTWTITYKDLPQIIDGKDASFTVREDAVDKYSADKATVINKESITNTYSPVTISGTKTWNDSGYSSVKKPDSITVNLLANGNLVASKSVTAATSWKYSFDNLPKYDDNGQEIVYTITENNVSDYSTTVNGYNITNTYTPGKTSVTVKKEWKDNNNQDGKRPDSVAVQLLSNGEKQGEAVALSNKNGWTHTWGNLDEKDKESKEITYTVEEVNVLDEYTTAVSAGEKQHYFVITNTHTPETTTVSGTKTWDDNNNQDGKRPSMITVNLLADGEQIQSQDITADQSGNWKYSFTNLPKYKDGKEIKYAVNEEPVDSYKTTIENYNITNKHTPETTEISGTKTWNDNENQDGKRPTSITVRLLADGNEVASKAVTAGSGWTYKFDKLPVYSNGNKITYTISEDAIDGYSSSRDGFNIINSYTPEQTVLNVQKVWDDSNNQDGKRPNSVTVQLYADETASGEPVTLSASNNWYHTWTKLPIYKGGEKIKYTVKETSDLPKGYTPKISGDAEKGYIITNSYTPETTTVSGSKTWSDHDNQDGERPDKIKVRLLADGKEVSFTTVSAADGWKYKFDKLPVYHDGDIIKYSISEDAIPDYTTEISGYNITNSYTPEETSVSVLKNWADSDNQDGKRPNDVQVQLLADGDASGEPVTLTSSNWMYTWKNLPMYKNSGTEIKYTVKEVSKLPDGYSSIITGDAVRGYTITNSYQPEKTTISGSKTWDDNNNQDGKRPDSIMVKLLADGIRVAEKTVTAEDGWKYSFEDLPVYKNGQKIKYSIAESGVENYSTTIEGYNITNSYTPEKTSVTVLKRWNDSENQDGKRPNSVTVQLYADDEVSGKPVTLTESSGWLYTWIGLPMYKNDGTKIAYTVKEDSDLPSGYTSSVTGSAEGGYVITNSYTPEKTTISGTKTWDDKNNQDGKRPDSITVKLLADGDKVAEKTVTADDGWKYSFEDLPVYKNGQKITYTIAESAVENYSTAINGFDITNSYTPEKTSLSVLKRWYDSENQDGKRPNSVTVQLYADGKASGEPVTLTESGNWLYTWTRLPMYEDGGTKIQYTVQETSKLPDGYTSSVTGSAEGGYVITNSYTPPTDPTETPTPSTTPTETPTPSTTPTETPAPSTTATPTPAETSTPSTTPTTTPTTTPGSTALLTPSNTPGTPSVSTMPGRGDNNSKGSAGTVKTGGVLTGDNSNTRIWKALLTASAILLVILLFMTVRSRRKHR